MVSYFWRGKVKGVKKEEARALRAFFFYESVFSISVIILNMSEHKHSQSFSEAFFCQHLS